MIMMLKKLGKVLHISPHKMLIVRSTFAPAIGSTIVTKNMENIGEVFDVFGPVEKPYVSIKPKEGIKLEKFVGEILYVHLKEKERSSAKKKKFNRRKIENETRG